MAGNQPKRHCFPLSYISIKLQFCLNIGTAYNDRDRNYIRSWVSGEAITGRKYGMQSGNRGNKSQGFVLCVCIYCVGFYIMKVWSLAIAKNFCSMG